MKLEINFWKKFLFSQFQVDHPVMEKDWFQESQEIIDLFFENSADLMNFLKNEKQKGNTFNRQLIKKVLEVRAKADKKIKLKKLKK